ncbi:hypothetical protein PIIN_11579 [Serendipita indica DSM 11827]|uniref:Uncharacterized protein n=1 Tax=Serendipita indica (strain DSM 11827) TaxID=1109443 RepID=G4U209_SERID|nr:hypothetical protein PIIN_11579 [Serendipita indica DSM 11827]
MSFGVPKEVNKQGHWPVLTAFKPMSPASLEQSIFQRLPE